VSIADALARRVRRARDDPRAAAVADLTWIGEEAIARVAGPRHRATLQGAWRAALHRGDAVACPVCESTFDAFMPAPNRPDAICPRCLSQERHRALWIELQTATDVFTRPQSLLHFAPEATMARRLRAVPTLRHRSADLDSPLADEHFDITAIPHPDGAFDTILCSHVLEHVDDDARAMRELRRVLAPGGLALVMVPIAHDRETTLEDPTITTPEQRAEVYWQHDHVRLYGRDFADRLRAAGFEVSVSTPARALPPATVERYGLHPADDIFRCT
jgi:hypothetical protein